MMRTLILALIASTLFAAGLMSPVSCLADQKGKAGSGEQGKAQAAQVEKQVADDVNRAIAATAPKVNVRTAPATVTPPVNQGNAGRSEIETEMEILDLL